MAIGSILMGSLVDGDQLEGLPAGVLVAVVLIVVAEGYEVVQSFVGCDDLSNQMPFQVVIGGVGEILLRIGNVAPENRAVDFDIQVIDGVADQWEGAIEALVADALAAKGAALKTFTWGGTIGIPNGEEDGKLGALFVVLDTHVAIGLVGVELQEIVDSVVSVIGAGHPLEDITRSVESPGLVVNYCPGVAQNIVES